jgi:hypothetical protein
MDFALFGHRKDFRGTERLCFRMGTIISRNLGAYPPVARFAPDAGVAV